MKTPFPHNRLPSCWLTTQDGAALSLVEDLSPHAATLRLAVPVEPGTAGELTPSRGQGPPVRMTVVALREAPRGFSAACAFDHLLTAEELRSLLGAR